MKPVKLGIIGCGIAARELHWPALKELKDKFEILVVCNHTEKKAKEFSQLVGNVPYVLDYKKVLEMPDVEAVDIILPIELNYEVVSESMKYGKHILVEKPLASSLDEAAKLVNLEKNYSKISMVAENYRYRKIYARARSFIEQGKIGKVYSVIWNAFQLMDRNNQYGNIKWRQENKHIGGFITDGGVHNIATLREIFGNLSYLGSFIKQVNPGIGTVDTFSMQFTTQENVSGILNLYFSSNGYNENRMMIFGSKGTIIIENENLTIKNNERTDLSEKFDDDDGFKSEFGEFYESIRNNKTVKSTFFEAYCDLKILIDAVSTSVK